MNATGFTEESIQQGWDALQGEYGISPAVAKVAPVPDFDNTPANDDIPSGVLLLPMFNILSSKVVPHWQLTSEEVGQIADAWGNVVDKYFPDAFGRFGVEIQALAVTAMIIMPKLDIKKKPSEKETDQSRAVSDKEDEAPIDSDLAAFRKFGVDDDEQH